MKDYFVGSGKTVQEDNLLHSILLLTYPRRSNMFEITYRNNGISDSTCVSKDSIYDFTFEERYDVFHQPCRGKIEYLVLDRNTGLTSLVMDRKSPLDASDYPFIIPKVLFSIKYNGDQRYKGAAAYPPIDLIDLIFRQIMPLYGYAVREQQVDMAKSIYKGLRFKKVTLCEAEVGTGKTMAYLVAGFVAKVFDDTYNFMGYPVTITTSSIELQKSIMEKEIPALSDMLMDFGIIDYPLKAVLRKGKEHYFCPKRYHEHLDSLMLHPALYSQTIAALKAQDLPNTALDLDGLLMSPHIKSRICVKGSCYDCPRTDHCRYSEFIQDAIHPFHYDFQITNHNLFLMDQKMRSANSNRGSLVPFNFCIVDEAHKLAETAVDVFGAELQFTEVADYLYSVQHNGGNDPKDRLEYKLMLAKASRLNNRLLSKLNQYQFKTCEDICEVKVEITGTMADTLKKLIATLRKIGEWSVHNGATGGNTAMQLTEKLSAFLVQENNMVWISYDKSTNTKSLCCTPTDLKAHLRDALWMGCNTHFALTSGTMMDDTGFSFFKDELGITGCLDAHKVSEFSCSSPFDYQNHTRMYISENMPRPDMADPDYIAAVANEVVQLIKATHGHTAVLFTSYKALNAVYELVEKDIKEYPLIKMTRSNKNAISQFKESGNGVLFASGSMWEGVDCAGDILSSVIIVRLPFPLRTQIMEFKKKACANMNEFVQKYAVPQMIIKLRQGAGRLIRTESDTGILAILDARAAEKGAYRNRVLKALGKYPLITSVDEAAAFMDSIKDENYAKGATGK